MAHAYETFARGGKLTYGTLSPGAPERGRAGRRAPVPGPGGPEDDRPLRRRPAAADRAAERRDARRTSGASGACISPAVAEQVTSLLSGVVQSGTATRAQIPGVFVAGKTGHDRELRRRVVRRLDAGDHRRRVGRLPGRAAADGDGVRRRAGGRRHVPGAHLQGLRRAGRCDLGYGKPGGAGGRPDADGARRDDHDARRRRPRPDDPPRRRARRAGGARRPRRLPTPEATAPAGARRARAAGRGHPAGGEPAPAAPGSGRGRGRRRRPGGRRPAARHGRSTSRPPRRLRPPQRPRPRRAATAARRCATRARRSATAARPPW